MPRRVLVVLAGVLVLGGLGAGAASAGLVYPFDGNLFSPSGSFGELGANSVAVDGANGETYVASARRAVDGVYVFETSTGASLASLDGSLTPAGSFGAGPIAVAANSGTGDVYVSDAADSVVDVFDAAGGYVCQITGRSTPSASECNGTAGSDTPAHGFSSPRGVAVDQATGEVYVVDAGNAVVNVFSVAGAYLRQISSASVPGGFGTVDWVAVSGFNGHVYVVDDGPKVVDEFDATGAWVATWTGANTPAGTLGEHSAISVAVDDVNGRVYVGDPMDRVVDVFDASGEYVTQLRGLNGPRAVTVDQASHRVYVSDPPNIFTSDGAVDIFGPGIVVPGVVTASASGAGATSATVGGVVNPEGIGLSGCRFEYGTDVSYGQSAPCVPAAESIPADSGEHAVSAHIAGLVPGTAYHFRLSAVNANGASVGEDATFQTLPPPSIGSAAAVNVTGASADLTAEVDPNGFDTTYRFEWGTSTSYGASVPVPAGDIGAGTTDVPVSAHLSGLSADTTYHWRVVASNENGTAPAGDHTFVYDTSGGGLPDNRSYEMVTPPRKNAAAVGAGFLISAPEVAEDGSRLIAASIQCFAGASSCTGARESEGEPFAFTRTSAGWVTSPLAPPAARFENHTQFTGNTYLDVNANTGAVLFSIATPPSGEDDFYARQLDGSIVDVGPATPPAGGQGGQDGVIFTRQTADLSHVVYQAHRPLGLWPFDATSAELSAYEYVDVGNAQPALVGVSGGRGSTDLIGTCGTTLGSAERGPTSYGDLSADGGTVFFTVLSCASGSGANAGVPVPADELFARIDGSRTVFLSGRSPLDCTSAACAGSSPGGALFQGASGDGSRVFFTDSQQLTDDASSGGNLYEYDFHNPAGHNLVAVSAGDSSGGGPRVTGVVAISQDGSHAYFVAQGVLSASTNDRGQAARSGANNLYVFERDASHPEGRVAFIASLPNSDAALWSGQHRAANVTPDGRFLVFTSHGQLTADDTSSTGAEQVFRCDAQAGVLARISIGEGGFNDNGNAGALNASIVSAEHGEWDDPGRLDPTMSHDGSFVFFQSPVALTPGALNEVHITTFEGTPIYAGNVYEWHEGHVSLISDGRDTSQFDFVAFSSGTAVDLLGSDATGANVFFTTADPLVRQDTDTGLDYYDARICTTAEPCISAPPQPAPPCQGEACHGTPGAAPVFGAPGSAVFSGAGNLTPAAGGPAVKAKKSKPKPKKKAKKRKVKRKGKARGAARTGKHVKRGRK